MRKLVLVGIIGLLLVGCGDKKIDITEDYLSGKWDCQITSRYAKLINGKFSDYEKPEFKDNLSSFRVDDGKIYVNSNNEDYWGWLLSIDWINKETSLDYDDYTVKESHFFDNVSDNKFTYRSETESRSKKMQNTEDDLMNYKAKHKYICTRIN